MYTSPGLNLYKWDQGTATQEGASVEAPSASDDQRPGSEAAAEIERLKPHLCHKSEAPPSPLLEMLHTAQQRLVLSPGHLGAIAVGIHSNG